MQEQEKLVAKTVVASILLLLIIRRCSDSATARILRMEQ
jgi:hypothetical protein